MSSLTIPDAITQYQDEHLTARNLAPLTRLIYASDLKQVGRYLTEQLGLVHIDQVRPRHLDGFLVTLDQRGLRGSSRRRKVATMRSLFRFLVQQGILTYSTADEILLPEREREERRVLSEIEYKRLMATVQHEVRDGAILELLLQTGIRQSECAAIALSDMQLPARVSRDEGNVGSLRVHGKGRKDRVVTLNYKACRALKAYLAVRPKIDEEALFLTKFEKPLGTRSIRNIVSKYLNEAGIPGASTHALRHTFAAHHVRKGTKLDVVRQALGHESLATTSVYVGLAREVMDQELQRNAL
ncbi:MAG: tyrosine-type recombinase/integrase [Chloroflexia bacterium]|nr:tyrosine-type recombinase/integrase [Chloroflexia bacterium]